MTKHIKNKTPVLGESIPVLGVKLKWGWYILWLLFKLGIRSAISFKRSRRELSIDLAEQIYIEKLPNTHYPGFSFISKTGVAFPKMDVSFNCEFIDFCEKHLKKITNLNITS